MASRGGSPVNGADSGFAGVNDDHTEPNIFSVLVPRSEGINGRDVSSGDLPAPLASALFFSPGPGLSSSSGRSARDCSSTDRFPLSFAFSAASSCLRRATSGSFGQAGVFAATSASSRGGGSARGGGPASGARSRYSIIPSPLRLSPRSFMNWRKSLVSSGTFSSSSSARALPALHASATASATAAAATARRSLFGFRLRIAIPFKRRRNAPSPRGPLWPGSGRFCGTRADEALEQQPDHPGDDGHVGKVKNVPIEAEACGIDVKQHEIDHRPVGEAVDGVPDRPADDEAEAERGESRGRPRQPNPQQNHGDRFQRQECRLPQRPLLAEQAVTDAGVPGEHKVEEGGEPHDAPRREIDHEQEPELGRLVDRRGRYGHRERERGQRPPKEGRARTGCRAHGSVFGHHRYSAALRIASHSRSALASRGETSG